MARMVALLRGVNVGGNRKVPMKELAALCGSLGFTDAQTYLQSGNVVFTTRLSAASAAQKLEKALSAEMGVDTTVVMRDAGAWRPYAEHQTVRAALADPMRAKFVHVAWGAGPVGADAVKALMPRCTGNETIALLGDALLVDYADGVARSKLTPAALDKACGQTMTARNVRTVVALWDMLNAPTA